MARHTGALEDRQAVVGAELGAGAPWPARRGRPDPGGHPVVGAGSPVGARTNVAATAGQQPGGGHARRGATSPAGRGSSRPGPAAGRRPRARRAAGRRRRRPRRRRRGRGRTAGRPATPASCSVASRSAARARSSSSGPNWIDSVGQALAQAGVMSDRQPVVAQGALPGPPVVRALVDDAVRAGGDAVAAAVADVLLDDDGAELGAEQRPGRAHVEAGGVGAVLADVRWTSATGRAPPSRRPGVACSMNATWRQRVGAQATVLS